MPFFLRPLYWLPHFLVTLSPIYYILFILGLCDLLNVSKLLIKALILLILFIVSQS